MIATQQILEELKSATDSSPAAPATPLVAIPDNPPLTNSQAAQESAPLPPSRPQSSPKSARLSRQDLRDLIGICNHEIGHCGLTQDAGRRAFELKEKLNAIHKHGWPA